MEILILNIFKVTPDNKILTIFNNILMSYIT